MDERKSIMARPKKQQVVDSKTLQYSFLYEPVFSLFSGDTLYFKLIYAFNDKNHQLVKLTKKTNLQDIEVDFLTIDYLLIERSISLVNMSPDLKIGLSISTSTLKDKNTFYNILTQIRRQCVDPNRLFIEISETQALTDLLYAAELLGNIELSRTNVVIDDFGCGDFSELYLTVIDPEIVKIDVNTHENDNERIFELAKSAKGFGMKVVASGIRSKDPLKIYRSGCFDYAQGPISEIWDN